MRRVLLTCAVRMDEPPICGDVDSVLLLQEGHAEFAVNQKLGVYYPGEDTGPTRAELEREEHARLIARDADGDSPVERALDGVEEPEEIKQPYGNSPKSSWIRYACSIDPELTEERGELMTKADLMSKYGSRL